MTRLTQPAAVLIACGLTALLGASSPAAAEENEADGDEGAAELTDEEREQAMRHFEAGSVRFEDQRYREAIDHFEAAYEISGSPDFLYNIGRCHEELGEERRAVESYELYLRLRPDAEDADEVRAAIERLGGPSDEQGEEDEAVEEEADPQEEEQPEWPPGLRIGAGTGASHVLFGEWGGTMVPLDLFLHYPLLDWLFVTGVLSFGSYIERSDTSVAAGKPKSQIGLFAGVSAMFELSRRVDLITRLGVVPTGVFRRNYKTATWLAFHAGAGVAVWIYGGWGAFIEALGGFGPVFVPDARIGDPWFDDGDPSPSADVGGRIGFYYAFD
jgi:tetratricopeptide (TPR) repeat protein